MLTYFSEKIIEDYFYDQFYVKNNHALLVFIFKNGS